ncbi:hypothetical protein C8F01DRAFT_158054 [Mycena amicta]|nr:hypothetical protein C8F01DRAFT_158054 [Mycena amicta]
MSPHRPVLDVAVIHLLLCPPIPPAPCFTSSPTTSPSSQMITVLKLARPVPFKQKLKRPSSSSISCNCTPRLGIEGNPRREHHELNALRHPQRRHPVPKSFSCAPAPLHHPLASTTSPCRS